MLEKSGFAEVRWGKQIDVFSGSRHESSAAQFDTRGVTFAAVKAGAPERPPAQVINPE